MPGEGGDRFTVRRYQAGDEAAILELFARSFHAARDPEHWRWKYERNPSGNGHISVALERSALVAHYAGYPVPFRLGGHDLVAHQIGDTMTDSSIRHVGRGPTSLLGRTALHFYETFCEGQVAFNYGFNVSNIQKFSLRFLRSDRVEAVAYRHRDLTRDPLPPLGRLERLGRGIQLELVREVSPEWDGLFASAQRHYGFLVRRNSAYVRWRYLECPDVPYIVVGIRKWRQLVGWLVFRIRGSALTLGDLLLEPDHTDAFELALRHLVHVYAVNSVEGWFPDRPPWMAELLRSARLEAMQEPQDLSVMCVPFTMDDATERMRSGLYYTMGDSDLF